MAYMAKVIKGKVIAVHSRTPEYNATQSDAGQFIQTSYNIRGGVYYDTETGLPAENQAEKIAEQDGRQRKNFAGIGFTYDEQRDAFIPPKPFDSWLLNEETCLWDAPVPYPTDGEMYRWDEETTNWILIEEEN